MPRFKETPRDAKVGPADGPNFHRCGAGKPQNKWLIPEARVKYTTPQHKEDEISFFKPAIRMGGSIHLLPVSLLYHLFLQIWYIGTFRMTFSRYGCYRRLDFTAL